MQRALRLQLAHIVEMRLSIGGVTIGIASRDPNLALSVPPAVARFTAERSDEQLPTDIQVHAQWMTAPRPITGRLLFDSGGLWQLHESGNQLCWTFTSPRFGTTPYKTAVFDRDFSTGEIYLYRPYFDVSVPIYPMEYPLDELAVTNWLALGRGIEIHGCGVHDSDGAGYLFTGHSGAGKTTIARLWKDLPGVRVLSDDRIILRRAGDRILMHGTPWHGDEPLALQSQVPLTRGFVLHHGHRNECAELAGVDAIGNLLVRSFPPFFSASALDFTLRFLSDVCQCAPFSQLGFVPNRELPDFIREVSRPVSVL